MSSRLIARRRYKKATVLVSPQSFEKAIADADRISTQLLTSDPMSQDLDQIEEALSFLEQVKQQAQQGASTLEDYLDDVTNPQIARRVEESIQVINNMANKSGSSVQQQPDVPVVASGSDNWVTDRDTKVEKVEVPQVAVSASRKKAAPVPVAAPAPIAPPAPAQAAPAKKPSTDIKQLSSDTLAKIQKALAAAEDLMNDKTAQAFIAAIAEELMNRPIEQEDVPAPKAATFKGLNLAAYEGSWISDEDTGEILEGGERLPEIAKARKLKEDNTGITLPPTELPSKFASEMTTQKALKLSDRLADQLKSLYLEAKGVTESNDSRPVREAVEAIYRAYDLFGEASKVLNKQQMQEEAEAKALEVKEQSKKSSLLMGLKLAAEDEEKSDDE